MASFVKLENDASNPTQLSSFKKNNENNTLEFPAFRNFEKDEEITFASQISGPNLFNIHGAVPSSNSYDCYGITVSFTSNKDDTLAEKRKNFFRKFFLYDSSHNDVM